jgi:peptidoglycan/xylan/chitin deacetylase (PgdA/CDA1 family)
VRRALPGHVRIGLLLVLACSLAPIVGTTSRPSDVAVLASAPPAARFPPDLPLDRLSDSSDAAEPEAATVASADLDPPAGPTSAPEPTPSRAVGRIANTGGAGANVRVEPSASARAIRALAEQGSVLLLGATARDAAGRLWQQVQLPGTEVVGWVADSYVRPTAVVGGSSGAGATTAAGHTARPDVAARVPILMYHYIGPLPPVADQIRRGLTVSTEAFDAQLDWLATHGFEAVTMDQLAEAWWGAGTLPPRPVVLTFDDGYAETAALVSPRLAARGWPGVFYVVTGFVGYGPYVSWAQLRALLQIGMSVESHTVSHWELPGLADSVLRKELQDARRDLQAQLGVAASQLGYPSGRYTARVRAAAEAAGYRTATTTRWGIATRERDPLTLPRLRVWGGESLAPVATALGR